MEPNVLVEYRHRMTKMLRAFFHHTSIILQHSSLVQFKSKALVCCVRVCV